ncbi:PP2C family protein-serine/threonine phosphatase [Occallatibacter riparius]|uniref:Serine/threonine-protein phosphatase n=1 Tax=Occallatibacter riparius TaxID=1002689 RepID=A0A9J7BV82_9BACT|nr:PP2C family protein-serine/threonine phosphatase [Occallatibacter riparius]UWZ85690.1 serine/threonine-protein phosphatase [Occallatibacter riparius]
MFHLTPRRMQWAWVAMWLGTVLAPAQDHGIRDPSAVSVIGSEAVVVNQRWQFHTGDDAVWADPAFDDSGWAELDADRPWGPQGFAAYHGFAWYRKRIELGAAPHDGTPYALLLPEIRQAYEVYWNGTLVGRCGSLPPDPVWYHDQAPHVFLLQHANSGVVAIRVWNAPPLSDEDAGQRGGFAAPPLVGTLRAVSNARDALNYEWLRRSELHLAKSLLYALVALLSLMAWVRNREQWVLFWMAGFTLPTVLTLPLLNLRLGIPYTVAMAAAQPIECLRDISLWFLLLWLMNLHGEAKLVHVTRSLAALALTINALDGVLVALAWRPEVLRAAQAGDALITVVNTLTQLFPIVLIAAAIVRHRRMDGPSLLVAVAALLVEMMTVVRDAAAQGQRFTHWTFRELIDGPFLTLGGSPVSPMSLVHALLFLCIVYAVFASFLEHRRHEVMVDHELRNAHELQRVLVPDTPLDTPGLRMTSAYRPAQEVGGDFFQVIATQDLDESITVVIGDVSGHGLAAAMSVSFLVGAIRAVDYPACGPAELLSRVNQCISGRLHGGFATCLALRVTRDGSCTASSAGHPGPYLDDRELEVPGALPLGILADAEYQEIHFELRPGQVCTLYTDGLLEARNRTGELYGFERLEKLFAGRPTATQAADAAAQFGQNDDITVVMIAKSCADEPLRATPAQELERTEEPALFG